MAHTAREYERILQVNGAVNVPNKGAFTDGTRNPFSRLVLGYAIV